MAGIYIHIPFCKKRCIYCDFYSTTQGNQIGVYINSLCKELYIRKDYLQNEPIHTIYIGGGTPSQLTLAEHQEIFHTIFHHFTIGENAEITMEANPDDLTEDYLTALRTLPINRISMGVQTFNDRKLELLNRRHTAKQAYDAVQRCNEAGFQNISIDLIYGLPNETLNDWDKDLQIALSLPIKHLSAYHLTYEKGTPLWELWEKHKVEEIDENLSIALYEKLIRRTKEAGFEHYEISNFCQHGYHSRHNCIYWEGIPYLGCGASAHSYNGHSRQWNIASLSLYIKGIQDGNLNYEKEDLSLETQYNEYIMTSLRTSKGFSPSYISSHFGDFFYDYALRMAKPHLKEGLLEYNGEHIKLSHEGVFIYDGIMSDFIYIED